MSSISEPIARIPMWAQALLAVRLSRRAVLWLPVNVHAATQRRLFAACDALEACIWTRRSAEDVVAILEDATVLASDSIAGDAARTIRAAAEAVMAATRADDRQVIDAAARSCKHAANSRGLNALLVAMAIGADCSVIGFACEQIGIRRRERLTLDVRERLLPLYPPDTPTPAVTTPRGVADEEDPTGGAR